MNLKEASDAIVQCDLTLEHLSDEKKGERFIAVGLVVCYLVSVQFPNSEAATTLLKSAYLLFS